MGDEHPLWGLNGRDGDIRFSLSNYQAFDLLDEFPPPIRRRLFGKVFQQEKWPDDDFRSIDSKIMFLRAFAVESQTAKPDWVYYDIFSRIKIFAERLYNDMRRSGVNYDDIGSAWSVNSEFYGCVSERVRFAEEMAAYGEVVQISPVKATARIMRRKGRRLRSVVDHFLGAAGPHALYLGEHTRAILADRERACKQALARHWWSDGERVATIADIAEFERRRTCAETFAFAKGIHQAGDERGYASIMLTVTLPTRFQPGEMDGACPEEAKAALTVSLRRFRAFLSDLYGDFEVESWHETRDEALRRKEEIERSGGWRARTRKVDGRWTTQQAPLLGRSAMGVVAWHPTERGVPHLHICLRCDPRIVDKIKDRVRVKAGEARCEISIRQHGEGDPTDGTNYALRHVLGDRPENRDARLWGGERGIRLVSWIGVTPPRTAWRAVYASSNEEITLERGRQAKAAMRVERFDIALLQLGALHSRRNEFPRLKIAYETTVAENGRTRRRSTGIVDPSAPEQGMIPMRPVGCVWEAHGDGSDAKTPIQLVTTTRSDKIHDAEAPPTMTPDDWFEWLWKDVA